MLCAPPLFTFSLPHSTHTPPTPSRPHASRASRYPSSFVSTRSGPRRTSPQVRREQSSSRGTSTASFFENPSPSPAPLHPAHSLSTERFSRVSILILACGASFGTATYFSSSYGRTRTCSPRQRGGTHKGGGEGDAPRHPGLRSPWAVPRPNVRVHNCLSLLFPRLRLSLHWHFKKRSSQPFSPLSTRALRRSHPPVSLSLSLSC